MQYIFQIQNSETLCCACSIPQLCLNMWPLWPSTPDSSVQGILPARIMEWVAISSSILLTQRLNPHLLHLLHWQADVFTTESLGKPSETLYNFNFKIINLNILTLLLKKNNLYSDYKINTSKWKYATLSMK